MSEQHRDEEPDNKRKRSVAVLTAKAALTWPRRVERSCFLYDDIFVCVCTMQVL